METASSAQNQKDAAVSKSRLIVSDLGPIWSLSEIEQYLNLLQQEGHDWSKYKGHLPNRTAAMCMALYTMHRDYLVESTSNAHGLYQRVLEWYNVQENGNTKSRKKRKFTNDPHHLRTKRGPAPAQIHSSLNEWFYSSIDNAYFSYNEFQECLNGAHLQHVRVLLPEYQIKFDVIIVTAENT